MKKKNLFVAVMVGAMAFAMSGCSMNEPTDAQRAQKVIDAYATGDVKTLKSYISNDDSLNLMLDALDETDASGMKEVYQKVYELTKDAEFVVAEEDKSEDDDGYAEVTIKTVDFTNALMTEMANAALEGGDAFADVPTWMMNALNTGGDPVEKTVKVRTHSNGSLYEGYNDELLDVMTGGFYDYIMTTMTSCVENNEYQDASYLLAIYDTLHYSLDEYIFPFDGIEYSDEDVEALIYELTGEFDDADGIVAGGTRVEDGVRIYILINYDVASTFTLNRLGFISSGSGDKISLSASIDGMESEGVSCVTTDFGSGAISE